MGLTQIHTPEGEPRDGRAAAGPVSISQPPSEAADHQQTVRATKQLLLHFCPPNLIPVSFCVQL